MRGTALLLAAGVALAAACAPAVVRSDSTTTSTAASPTTAAATAPAVAAPTDDGVVTGDELAYDAQTTMAEDRTVRFISTVGSEPGGQVMTGHAALRGTDLELQLSSVDVQVDGGGWSALEGGAFDPLQQSMVRIAMAQVDHKNLARALGSFSDLELVGEEDVAGVPTRHFRGTTDKASYVATQKPYTSVWLSMSETEPFTLDVWVGEDGHLVRFDQTSVTEQGTPYTFSTEFTDYGAAVVVAP